MLTELSTDKGLAVVIVLSDADAAFAMPEDFARQKHIWVNDFNEDDAHIYLDKLGAPQARNELFYEAGTRPMHLLAAAEGGVLEFIALAQREAQFCVRARAPAAAWSAPRALRARRRWRCRCAPGRLLCTAPDNLRTLLLGGGDVEDVVRSALLETLVARRVSSSCQGQGWKGVVKLP